MVKTVTDKPDSLVTTKETRLDYKCHIKCFERRKILVMTARGHPLEGVGQQARPLLQRREGWGQLWLSRYGSTMRMRTITWAVEGNERREIFRDDQDRRAFLQRVRRSLDVYRLVGPVSYVIG